MAEVIEGVTDRRDAEKPHEHEREAASAGCRGQRHFIRFVRGYLQGNDLEALAAELVVNLLDFTRFYLAWAALHSEEIYEHYLPSLLRKTEMPVVSF